MTRDEIVEVGEFMKRLEEDSSVRIIFEGLDSIYGLTYKGTNDKYLMIINKDICYEAQIRTLWHEAKHIYSHFNETEKITLFEKEKEANDFAKYCLKNSPELLSEIRTAW